VAVELPKPDAKSRASGWPPRLRQLAPVIGRAETRTRASLKWGFAESRVLESGPQAGFLPSASCVLGVGLRPELQHPRLRRGDIWGQEAGGRSLSQEPFKFWSSMYPGFL
jgi:hypothetical protein